MKAIPLLVAALAANLVACGKKGDDAESEAPRVVLVFDSGFDVSQPVFQDRILATYTLSCPDQEDADEEESSAADTTDTRKALLAEIEAADAGCAITEGLKFDASPAFAEIEAAREAWNQSVRDKTLKPEGDDYFHKQFVLNGLDRSSKQARYHGTFVASVIARDNPNVQLVLVDHGVTNVTLIGVGRQLIKSLTAFATPAKNAKGEAQERACRPEAEYTQHMANLADPELAAATANHVPTWKTQLFELAKKHEATLLNYSSAFSQELRVHDVVPESAIAYQTRLTGVKPDVDDPWRSVKVPLAEQVKNAGCPYWDYEKIFTAAHDMTKTHWAHLRDAGTFDPSRLLIVQAAGNGRGILENPGDGRDFADPELGRLLVGAHDALRQPSFFSTQGGLVSLYALGNDVIVAAPHEFETVVWGTSLSAPMAIRYITRYLPAALTSPEIIAELTARLDGNKTLPPEAMPEELRFKGDATSLFW